MTEAKKVQLDGERLEYAIGVRQAVMENLPALRDVVFGELEMEAEIGAEITLRVGTNPDDCITHRGRAQLRRTTWATTPTITQKPITQVHRWIHA